MGRLKAITILIIGCLIAGNTVFALAQGKDEVRSAKSSTMQASSSIPNQQNIPKLPTLPQLPAAPQTITIPGIPRIQKSLLETTKFVGKYIKTEINQSGEKIALIEDTKGNEIKLFISEKSKIFIKGTPISIDEVKEGDKVIVHYETKEMASVEKDIEETDIKRRNVLKYLFLVVNEPDSVNGEAQKEKGLELKDSTTKKQ